MNRRQTSKTSSAKFCNFRQLCMYDSFYINPLVGFNPDPNYYFGPGSGKIVGIRIRPNYWYPDPAKLLVSGSGKIVGIHIRQNVWYLDPTKLLESGLTFPVCIVYEFFNVDGKLANQTMHIMDFTY